MRVIVIEHVAVATELTEHITLVVVNCLHDDPVGTLDGRHLARFVIEVVEQLDLGAVTGRIARTGMVGPRMSRR